MRAKSSMLWRLAVVGLAASLYPSFGSAQKQTKYWGIGSYTKYVTIPGATAVGSKSCIACHSAVSQNFRHAYHAQQGIGCEDCHGAGSLHADDPTDPSKMVSYRKRTPREANGACLSCHAEDESVRNWMAGRHTSSGVRCTDCHQVHNQRKGTTEASRINFDTTSLGRVKAVEDLVPESKMMMEPRWQKNDDCVKCHQGLRGEMSLPYHHPLREGKVTCVDCHDAHGGPTGNNLREANVNQLCLRCHAQYRGPFAYQHPPVTENCMTCHTAHGSANTNLLAVSEPALCLQCHAGHHNGASLPLVDRCSNCHISIHGTDIPSSTGGSVFIDKGPATAPVSLAGPVARRPAGHPAVTSAAISPVAAALGGGTAGPLAGLLGGTPPWMQGGPAASQEGGPPPDSFFDFSFSPTAYRLIDRNGFLGRVGEYDSLQQSAGGDVEAAYVSVPHQMTLVTRANVVTGDDYHVAAQFSQGENLQVKFDMRSFLQQQDNYPFFGSVISPDIVPSINIPNGSEFGMKRRIGEASARVKIPNLPVHFFVKGNWQARVGENQLAWYDMGGDSGCNFCHFTSQFQRVNYTTRNVGGGAEVKLGRVSLIWEHDFSSFNDRLQFPAGLFGATLGSPADELPGCSPLTVNCVPNTPAGTYAIAPPAPNQYSSDTARLSWVASPEFILNGDIGYTRLRNLFTLNPQNSFNSNVTAVWRPLDRLRLTADYHQQNVLNNFTPLYTLYGDVSYHQHSAGLRGEYDLTHHLAVEARYERNDISRSNSALWPQFYSPDNTDLLLVVPSTFSNTTGLALRYRGSEHWSARAGYDWTGTHDPGYLTVPKSNNRLFTNFTASPTGWLSVSNDLSVIVQNAFAVIQRKDRFYAETLTANVRPASYWDLELGYSYQQYKLNTFMAIQNDPGVNYLLQEPFVPYNQLSQTYWIQSGSRFWQERLGFNVRFTYNSARSGMQPDLNPNDAALLGNAALIQQGVFDPVLFGQALSTGLNGDVNQGALKLAATQISQVIVPEFIGQAKLYYVLPRRFNAGLLFYYGSYRDEINPNLNGVLRTFTFYAGRSW